MFGKRNHHHALPAGLDPAEARTESQKKGVGRE
jgi:hypothetical protein